MNSLQTCYSPKSNSIYGDFSLSSVALNCASKNNNYNLITLSPTNNNNNCNCIISSNTCKYNAQMGCATIFYTATNTGNNNNNGFYSCYNPFELFYASSDCAEMMGSPNVYYIRMLSASTGKYNYNDKYIIIIIIIVVISNNNYYYYTNRIK